MEKPETLAARDLLKFDYVFKWNRRILKILGIWPLDTEEISVFERFLTVLLTLNLGVVIIAQWTDLVSIWGQFDPMLDNLSANIGGSMALIKLFIILWNFDTLRNVIAKVRTDWSALYTIQEFKLMMDRARIGRLFSIVGPASAIPAGMFFALTPQAIYTQSKNGTEIMSLLPLRSKYLYDVTSTPVYQFSYLSQTVHCYTASAAYSAIDCFFAALALHVCSQLEILGCTIRGVGKREPMIRNIVERHLRLVKYVEDLERIYSAIICVQLIVSSLLLCSIGYKFITSLDGGYAADVGKFTFYFIAILMQIFLYCYSGQCLIDESTRLTEAAYECPWYDMKGSDARAFMLMQARAQAPFKITALKFCYMSHSCFTNVRVTGYFYDDTYPFNFGTYTKSTTKDVYAMQYYKIPSSHWYCNFQILRTTGTYFSVLQAIK
ncbi:odorant receptor 4-like [Neodiprion virginianus]|uniref:odorant receptor 4-like n=1 Tax=Neodiprion virginianus TaxID=2961670 RepID=UPI001EE69D76|nr:odorant receptor 4-like [Neodiprion virginianus]